MPHRNQISILNLLASGLGVGWIVGLSASPAVSIVLGSIMALVVSLTSAIAGLARSDRSGDEKNPEASGSITQKVSRAHFDPRPIAFLVVGLAIGASIGAYARTNDWLGVNPRTLVERWKGVGLEEAEIRTRLFSEVYPRGSSEGEDTKVQHVSANAGVLFAVKTTDCGSIRLLHGEALWVGLRQLNNPRIEAFLNVSRDSVAMEALKELLCP